ncbi:MAG: beta-lactamase family protein, partial [Fidelibacterota bacterium]
MTPIRYGLYRLLCAWLILTALSSNSCERNPQGPDNLPAELLQSVLEAYRDSVDGILGTAVYIDYAGYESWAGAAGYFDSTLTRPLEVDDQFRIGSVNKTFTATLILQLWEEDLIELDRVLSHYLPSDVAALLDSIPYANTVTVRQALMHRSGLYNYVRSWPLLESVYQDPGRYRSVLEVLRIVRDAGSPDFAPGMNFRYSNTNYLLLGVVIEQVTGQSYSDVLDERICQRLGLSYTFMPAGPLLGTSENLAHGYEDAV